MSESLLTVKDVQRRLAIGENLAYELINGSAIDSIRIGAGRSIRIEPAALERFIAGQRHEAKESASTGWTPVVARGGHGNARRTG